MRFVIFVAPFFSDNALRFIEALTRVEGVAYGLVTQEPQQALPNELRQKFVAHWQVADALDAQQIARAARGLAASHGQPWRLLGAMEQIQVQLAEVREAMGIEGMGVEAAKNFRDKARMKYLFHTHGVPTARFLGISSDADAWRFAEQVSFPIVLKPLAGAATQATFRVEDGDQLRAALAEVRPSAANAAIVEEFVTGQESSFETMSLDGKPLWHSWTHYYPTPLEVMRNAWMQWSIVLPNNADDPAYDDIRAVNDKALAALGMGTGMTHLEWFRRADGSIAISEVAARPPGAQITTLISRAFDVDFVKLWGELMIFGKFDPPERKFAAGACFLRGQGAGVVKAVHGWQDIHHQLEDVITDFRLPMPGHAKGLSYEGEGWVIVKHESTFAVEEALKRIISNVRVELG